jgi:hypothetical protein
MRRECRYGESSGRYDMDRTTMGAMMMALFLAVGCDPADGSDHTHEHSHTHASTQYDCDEEGAYRCDPTDDGMLETCENGEWVQDSDWFCMSGRCSIGDDGNPECN